MADAPAINFDDALANLRRRAVMGTEFDSRGLQQLAASLRLQSFYSARTLNEDLLKQYKAELEKILAGGQNDAYARQKIEQILKEMGYAPAPGEEGTITDLSSNARINLVLQTNRELAQGEAWWMQGQEQAILDAFPAQELFRAFARMKPRDWLYYRWPLAGLASGRRIGDGWTVTPTGRMVALKNHPIWNWIGSTELFPDALDVIWPPFAFNSGMRVEDVARADAEAMGILKSGERIAPTNVSDAIHAFERKLEAAL